MSDGIHRRGWLRAAGGAFAVTGGVGTPGIASAGGINPGQFVLGLNTSTLRGHHLPLEEVVTIAIDAGYKGLEPWIDELEAHQAAGRSIKDLGKKLADSGVGVESAIGFFDWIVDDPARRKQGLESARKSMDLVRMIGGKRLAAPPVGATDARMTDLDKIAERYRALLELGDQMGVVPQAEIWGPSRTLSKLSEAAYVAIGAGHPRACVLADVYHLYRGGSDFTGLSLLGPSAIHVLHFNDYPAKPSREKLTDADRVYPGDGVAPLAAILTRLSEGGFKVMLSLELFNRQYWAQDPRSVARTGLARMRGLVGPA